MSALAVTHRREVDACPIKVETINIGCQIDGTGSRVRDLLYKDSFDHNQCAGASDVADHRQPQD